MSSSARRALRILETIGRSEQPLAVTEIARAMDLPPGTAFRSLDALVKAGLVARYQSSSRYVMGGAVEQLRRSLLRRFRMREAVLPYLHQLASLSGETACLHVRLGWYGLRIASALGTGEVANAPVLGETYILGQHFAGRAMLAVLGGTAVTRFQNWRATHGIAGTASEGPLTGLRRQGYSAGEEGLAGRAPIAFPLLWGPGWAAALALEGPVFDGQTKTPEFAAWQAIASDVKGLARGQPDIFANPFGSLDPGAFRL